MNFNQKVSALYALLGVVSGIISEFLPSLFNVLAPALIWLVSFIALVAISKYKKIPALVIDTLVTFILAWLVVWIFLFNVL